MATITTRSGKGSALTHQEVDANFTGLNTELGQKELASNKGVANGYASLDAAGKVPSAQLPSYVDDVVEAANLASLPGTGETGKIYVTLDTNKTYRWSGSAYVEISPSPGSTDSLAEGSTNLYFTQARARASVSASGSLSYNSSTGVFSFSDAVTSVAGRTGAVTLTSSDVGLGNVENKSSATIRGELTSSNVTTALGFTPANKAGDTFTGPVLLTQNPVGTTYGNGVSATPTYYLGQGAGNDDAWKIYGESDGGNQVRLVFETNDDNDANEKFLFRYKKTYGDFAATDLLAFDTNGITFKGNSVAHGGNFTGFALSSGQVTTALGYTPYNSSNPSGYLTDAMRYRGSVAQASVDSATLDGFYTQNNLGDSDGLLVFNSGGSLGPFQMRFKYTGLFEFRNKTDSANWNSWKQVLHSANYNSYSPTLTGTGASGTWGISITGTARGVGTSDPALGTGGLWVTTGTGLNVARNNTAYLVLDAGNYSSYALPLTGGNVTVAADTAASFTNSDLGGSHYTNRGNRYLTSNGSNWLADGQDVPLVISGSYSTTTRGRLGLALHNESSTDGAFSPAIVFGSRSNSGSYNSGYAFIMGKKTGANSGVDTNWNSGELHFYAVGSGYVADTPNFTVTNGSSLVNGNTILHAGNYSSYALPLSGGAVSGTVTFGSFLRIASDNSDWGTGNYFRGQSNHFVLGVQSGGTLYLNYGNSAGTTRIEGSTLINGNTALHAANYSSYALPLSGGTLSGNLTVNHAYGSSVLENGNGLVINGNYTNGQYSHRWRKWDDGGGVPLYLQWTSGTANSWSNLARFGNLSGDGNWLRVFGPGRFDGALTESGNQVLHAGNYTGYNGILRALGGADGMNFNTLNYNSMYFAYIENSPNKPTSYSYPYGTILTFDPSPGNAGRAQFYISHAGNDLTFRGGWNNNDSWQAWNRVLTNQNYNSYSPTLTGGGASGTWGINITGNAATVTNGITTGNYTSYVVAKSGGSFTGVVTGISPSVQSAISGVNAWNAAFRTEETNVGTTAGYIPGFGQTSVYTSGYRSHMVLGSYRTASGWGGGPFLAWGGSDNNTTEAWVFNTGGTITHTSGRTVLDSSNYSSYALPLSGGTVSGSITATVDVIARGIFRVQNGTADWDSIDLDANGATHIINARGAETGLSFQFDGTERLFLSNGGNLTASGNVTAYSDERVKANWRQLDDGFVVKLASVMSGIYDRTDIDLTQAGVSAQSLRNVLPQTVMESSDGELSVAYGNAALVSAVELAKELVALKHKVAELEARVH